MFSVGTSSATNAARVPCSAYMRTRGGCPFTPFKARTGTDFSSRESKLFAFLMRGGNKQLRRGQSSSLYSSQKPVLTLEGICEPERGIRCKKVRGSSLSRGDSLLTVIRPGREPSRSQGMRAETGESNHRAEHKQPLFVHARTLAVADGSD